LLASALLEVETGAETLPMIAFRKLDKVRAAADIKEVDEPSPGAGEVLLKVAACGVCGSDLHAYNDDPGYGHMQPPVTLGHECGGTIVALGEGVGGWETGQAVVVNATQGCCRCPDCRRGAEQLCQNRRVIGIHYDGCMAEFVKIEAKHIFPLPDTISVQDAAIIEPFTIALHCVCERSEIYPGDLVVVSGPGIIGMLCAIVARLRGARVMITGAPADAEVRLALAETLGFETVIADDQPLLDKLPRQPDALIEASGSSFALGAALDTVRPGGGITIVAQYARPVSWFMSTGVRSELTVRFSYGSSQPEYLQAMGLMEAGKIPYQPLLQHYPLAEAKSAFLDALAQKNMKPVLLTE